MDSWVIGKNRYTQLNHNNTNEYILTQFNMGQNVFSSNNILDLKQAKNQAVRLRTK